MASSLAAATVLWLVPLALALLGLNRPAWGRKSMPLLLPVSFLTLIAGLFFLTPGTAIGGGVIALSLVFPVLLVRHRLLRWLAAATAGVVIIFVGALYLWLVLYLAPGLRGWE